MDALDLRKVETNKKEMLEIDDDWEPFVRISISNQDFLAFCDIGSMVSTMPKLVYDSLKLDMDKLSSYHEHANGDISEIKEKVKGVQVAFLIGLLRWICSSWSQTKATLCLEGTSSEL